MALAKELVVGVNVNSYPPYYFHKDNQTLGFSIDVAELVAAELGYTLTYQAYPWARINQYLQEGKIDMVLMYLKSEQRKAYVHYSKIPYIEESYRFFKKKGQNVNYTGDLNSIKNVPVGVIRGYSYGPDFDQFKFNRKYVVGSETQLLDMLQKQRVQLILGNEAVIKFHAQTLELNNEIEEVSPKLSAASAYFAFSKNRKNSDQVADKFSNALVKVQNSSAYQRLLEKHQLALSHVKQGPYQRVSE